MTRALRLAAPAVATEPVASFDHRILSDLHAALRLADEAVQMARATPRYYGILELAELAERRDAAVAEALANLREVLP